MAALLLLAAAACGPLHDRSEGYRRHYPAAAEETQTENVARQKILHWVKDPKAKERVGFLEKNRTRLAGMREWREGYTIKNKGGTKTLGFINEDGVFFRYDRDGQLVRVGEYPVIDTGIKVFFGFPLSDNVQFEDLDPYKD